MAKSIQFQFNEFDFEGEVTRVDRKKLYGYTKREVYDSNGSACSLVTLSDDGAHILPSGATGLAKLNSQGNYISRSDIRVVRSDGSEAEKTPSSFTRGLALEEVESIDQYFDLNVKSIYQLTIDEAVKTQVVDLLKEKKVLKTDFNYRDGYDTDDAFILTSSDEVFLVIGSSIEYEYLSNEVLEDFEQDDDSEEEDDFDFGML